MCEEIRTLKDKLTKLANQFDKELLDRDKSLKQYQCSLWDDIQQLIQAIQRENEATRVMVHNMASSKADKKELHEARSKLVMQLGEKSDQAEVTAALSNFTSDNTQRLLDLRSELFNRIAESHN